MPSGLWIRRSTTEARRRRCHQDRFDCPTMMRVTPFSPAKRQSAAGTSSDSSFTTSAPIAWARWMFSTSLRCTVASIRLALSSGVCT